jgi:YgiT-type zinc finger domain-containing protein
MNDQIACPRCQIGNLQPVSATYTCLHNHALLSVPNMPAWKCDICQYLEFDYDALGRVDALTGRFGPPDDPVRPASKLPSVDSETAEAKLPHRLKP